MAKYGRAASKSVESAMHRKKKGTLRSGSGRKVKNDKQAMSNFPDYAGPLTETILLGNLAVFKRGRVEWDPVNLKSLNDPTLTHIVRPTFRDGYEV